MVRNKNIHTKFVGVKYRTNKSNDALNAAIEPTVKYASCQAAVTLQA